MIVQSNFNNHSLDFSKVQYVGKGGFQAKKLNQRKNFSKIKKVVEIPNLIEMQKRSYDEFLQVGIQEHERSDRGLEEVFNEIFPITDFDETAVLEYVSHTVDIPKYTPREALDRGATYSAPVRATLRLVIYSSNNPEDRVVVDAKEATIFLCDLPLMTDWGTFVINGVERVIVSQLHRSPGIFFEDITNTKAVAERHIYSARVIPYRGSWIDIEYDSKNILYVRIDKKKKILVTVLLKAFGLNGNDILKQFYTFETINIVKSGGEIVYKKTIDYENLLGTKLSHPIINPDTGEVVVKANTKFTRATIKKLDRLSLREITIPEGNLKESYFAVDVFDKNGEHIAFANDLVTEANLGRIVESGLDAFQILFFDRSVGGNVIRDILEIDKIKTKEDALLEIHKKLRPGEPATPERADMLFQGYFFNEKRYDLSRVGRIKINKRLKLDKPLTQTTLTVDDIVNTVRELENIRQGRSYVDDIDHIGHRRVKAVGEQLQNYIRVGLSRIEKTVKERLSIQDVHSVTPYDLLNAKPLVAAIKEFFGSYQLSQFMDQTNPLAEITHKRRLSALGPGGLNRDRAGFEVRDVHTSHYGRICPIETPEGPNIGLITSLTTYAKINEYGFIETPYRKVIENRVTDEVVYMSGIDEEEYYIAQANSPVDEKGNFINNMIAARHKGDTMMIEKDKVQYMDVAPMQMVSVSTAAIPFLEHNDANRALMGSNMQRQAVPLLQTAAPIVGTGLEFRTAIDTGAVIVSKGDGVIDYVDASKIIVRYDSSYNHVVEVHDLVKFKRSNQNTCMNNRPLVVPGQRVIKGQPLADGAGTDRGELALGKNIVIAFMPWNGYNYEDSILVSRKLVEKDVFTSIHIEMFEVEARDTKLGPEEITADIPNVREQALAQLDEHGIIRIGAKVKPDDILVGKVAPKGEYQSTPEEKLLRAIFGEKAGDVKDISLRVPPGIVGTVIDVQVITRRGLSKDGRAEAIEEADRKVVERTYKLTLAAIEHYRCETLSELIKSKKLLDNLTIEGETFKAGSTVPAEKLMLLSSRELSELAVEGKEEINKTIEKLDIDCHKKISDAETLYQSGLSKTEKGDELPAGVLKKVQVFVAIKRRLSVGDKMAGRHGNKGVVSSILAPEDMPFMEDGTPIDIVINPLGVPSRMNVGQVFEMHLGWAAKNLGLHVSTEVFDGADEEDIKKLLREAGLQEDGQRVLYDGRTGERFDQEVTVGVMYMLKLHHLVDTKIHARSTGPYSLVTQQPLGGKAQFGGQRFGEMEVWALEAYGAANILQEMLTVKSDDVTGRVKVYEAMVDGNFDFKPGLPESFNVLVKELQGLALDIELLTKDDLANEKNNSENV